MRKKSDTGDTDADLVEAAAFACHEATPTLTPAVPDTCSHEADTETCEVMKRPAAASSMKRPASASSMKRPAAASSMKRPADAAASSMKRPAPLPPHGRRRRWALRRCPVVLVARLAFKLLLMWQGAQLIAGPLLFVCTLKQRCSCCSFTKTRCSQRSSGKTKNILLISSKSISHDAVFENMHVALDAAFRPHVALDVALQKHVYLDAAH
jgi:hypothetical protein